VNLCSSCGLDFASVAAFDAHRRGTHAHLGTPDRPDGRRCLTADELVDRGWERDRHGRWVTATALRNRPRMGCYPRMSEQNPVPRPDGHPDLGAAE
jgi:hypothetical protein